MNNIEGFQLLPAPPGTCPTCATKHEPEMPHDAQSLFYQYRFYSQRGRWPTWKDAIKHSPQEIREHFETELRSMGEWTEPKSEIPDVLPTPQHTIGTVSEQTIPKRNNDNR